MRTRILTVLLLAGVLVGCGNDGSTPSDTPKAAGSAPSSPVATPTTLPSAIPPASGLVTTGSPVTVLAKPDQPAEACIGGVEDSYPPQCGGTVLSGFDWAEHPGDFEEYNGIRWGEFVVIGHFDGTTIDVTKVVPENEYVRPQPTPHEDLFKPLCPEPEGGWKVVDPSKTGGTDVYKTFRVARRLPGYADGFIDMDPKPAVINVRVTGDPAAAEKELRKVWGGALCVVKAGRDQAEIRRISDELGDLPGVLSWGGDNEPIKASVIWDDGSLQAWADNEYGDGVVTIYSALQPAPADR